eukprot:TRINITY_DN12126_c0_g1_i6.p1 TRINITY_DN12126_c0_g1~~TRINITY_DN12126_c0_g1_i6.p1  ORF type:complete len:495 (+),score=38.04 TRINITY_DN12126_c0_g1_i6:146-1486(+)
MTSCEGSQQQIDVTRLFSEMEDKMKERIFLNCLKQNCKWKACQKTKMRQISKCYQKKFDASITRFRNYKWDQLILSKNIQWVTQNFPNIYGVTIYTHRNTPITTILQSLESEEIVEYFLSQNFTIEILDDVFLDNPKCMELAQKGLKFTIRLRDWQDTVSKVVPCFKNFNNITFSVNLSNNVFFGGYQEQSDQIAIIKYCVRNEKTQRDLVRSVLKSPDHSVWFADIWFGDQKETQEWYDTDEGKEILFLISSIEFVQVVIRSEITDFPDFKFKCLELHDPQYASTLMQNGQLSNRSFDRLNIQNFDSPNDDVQLKVIQWLGTLQNLKFLKLEDFLWDISELSDLQNLQVLGLFQERRNSKEEQCGPEEELGASVVFPNLRRLGFYGYKTLRIMTGIAEWVSLERVLVDQTTNLEVASQTLKENEIVVQITNYRGVCDVDFSLNPF